MSGLGATAGFGGFAEVPKERPPAVAQGVVVDQSLFRTQFLKAVDKTENGARAVELILKVRNMGEETTNVGLVPEPGPKVRRHGGFANALLRVTPPIETDNAPQAYVLGYGVQSHQLHPGITHTVVVRYDLKPGAVPPAQITIDVGGFVLATISRRDQRELWQIAPKRELPQGAGQEDDPVEPAVIAQVTLPVRPEEG
ncbi:hypothetical protein GCM10009555_060320 [Acrocarpospora macrocephala]|uniref:Uncharacterized protein n=1 Tax=Acrocarpospora macrocephala TaxID=150177 RepID=A0A5M3WPP7_9ACTN|nr:hypothetical protein Amac_036990 [Acrocarpospora macrocephala]